MSIAIKIKPEDLHEDYPAYVFPEGTLCICLKDEKALDKLIERCRDIKIKRMMKRKGVRESRYV